MMKSDEEEEIIIPPAQLPRKLVVLNTTSDEEEEEEEEKGDDEEGDDEEEEGDGEGDDEGEEESKKGTVVHKNLSVRSSLEKHEISFKLGPLKTIATFPDLVGNYTIKGIPEKEHSFWVIGEKSVLYIHRDVVATVNMVVGDTGDVDAKISRILSADVLGPRLLLMHTQSSSDQPSHLGVWKISFKAPPQASVLLNVSSIVVPVDQKLLAFYTSSDGKNLTTLAASQEKKKFYFVKFTRKGDSYARIVESAREIDFSHRMVGFIETSCPGRICILPAPLGFTLMIVIPMQNRSSITGPVNANHIFFVDANTFEAYPCVIASSPRDTTAGLEQASWNDDGRRFWVRKKGGKFSVFDCHFHHGLCDIFETQHHLNSKSYQQLLWVPGGLLLGVNLSTKTFDIMEGEKKANTLLYSRGFGEITILPWGLFRKRNDHHIYVCTRWYDSIYFTKYTVEAFVTRERVISDFLTYVFPETTTISFDNAHSLVHWSPRESNLGPKVGWKIYRQDPQSESLQLQIIPEADDPYYAKSMFLEGEYTQNLSKKIIEDFERELVESVAAIEKQQLALKPHKPLLDLHFEVEGEIYNKKYILSGNALYYFKPIFLPKIQKKKKITDDDGVVTELGGQPPVRNKLNWDARRADERIGVLEYPRISRESSIFHLSLLVQWKRALMIVNGKFSGFQATSTRWDETLYRWPEIHWMNQLLDLVDYEEDGTKTKEEIFCFTKPYLNSEGVMHVGFTNFWMTTAEIVPKIIKVLTSRKAHPIVGDAFAKISPFILRIRPETEVEPYIVDDNLQQLNLSFMWEAGKTYDYFIGSWEKHAHLLRIERGPAPEHAITKVYVWDPAANSFTPSYQRRLEAALKAPIEHKDLKVIFVAKTHVVQANEASCVAFSISRALRHAYYADRYVRTGIFWSPNVFEDPTLLTLWATFTSRLIYALRDP